MKKLLFLLMLPLVLALSGCDDEGTKKVNPKKLEGIWEVYDASTAFPIGSKLTFFNDGRLFAKDPLCLYQSINSYKISNGILESSRLGQNKERYFEGFFKLSLDNEILFLSEQGVGNETYWVKLKKLEELPCGA